MLDKEMLRNVVIQGIEVMPTEVTILREYENEFREKEGYRLIGNITGVLYPCSYSSTNSSLQDKGEVDSDGEEGFLVEYNEVSKEIRKHDYFVYSNRCYEVITSKDDFEVYCDMRIKRIYDCYLTDKDLFYVRGKYYEVLR